MASGISKAMLKVHYADIPNMGDQLNALIIGKCFGYDIMPAPAWKADLSGIGSGLARVCAKPGSAREAYYAQRERPLYVWGMGFISNAPVDIMARDGVDYRVVRGELSRRRVEKSIGRPLDIPTGDAGLLAPRLIDGPVEKRYRLGVIPHFRERGDERIRRLAALADDSTVIDLLASPMEVIRQIASCELILSSSLHGLIVADAFGIPNLYVRASERPLGDGFKYEDYYSGYGLQVRGIDLSSESIDSLAVIGDRYRIRHEQVVAKQRALWEAFPFRDRMTIGVEPPQELGFLNHAVRLVTPCGLLRRRLAASRGIVFDAPCRGPGLYVRLRRWLVPFGFVACERRRLFGEPWADIVRGGALCRTVLWQKFRAV